MNEPGWEAVYRRASRRMPWCRDSLWGGAETAGTRSTPDEHPSTGAGWLLAAEPGKHLGPKYDFIIIWHISMLTLTRRMLYLQRYSVRLSSFKILYQPFSHESIILCNPGHYTPSSNLGKQRTDLMLPSTHEDSGDLEVRFLTAWVVCLFYNVSLHL